jgi:hypothetical protein
MSDRKLAQLQQLLADLSPAELQQAAALIEEKRATRSAHSADDKARADAWRRLEEIGRQLSACMPPGGITVTEQLSRDRSARDRS